MFGVDSGELFLIVLVAVVVIGPKDLPRVMRTIGHWVGKARGMANQFRSGVDQMVRESEITDLEQKWREQNDAIMQAHPMAPEAPTFGSAAPPVEEPADSGWGLNMVEPAGMAPVMKPLTRAAPAPPMGKSPTKPTPPRLDKDADPASPSVFPPGPAPRAADFVKPGRRAPRTVPGADRP